MRLPIGIEFAASTLEIVSFYAILVLLNSRNSLFHSKLKLSAYIIISSLIAAGLSLLNLPYYFVFIVFTYIILLKIFSKRKIGKIAVDVICANAGFFAVEFLLTIFFSMFDINVLTNNLILFGCLIFILVIVVLLNQWDTFVTKVRRVYLTNRSAFSFIAVNSFFSISILLNIWNQFYHLFWGEKWNLLGLIVCNYLMNTGFIVADIKRKRARAESDAYKTYGEHLKAVSEQLRSQQHEFNNQLQTIIGLAMATPNSECSQRIIQYCDELIENRKNHTGIILSQNDVIIEALIYSRIKLAEERGVRFQSKIFDAFSQIKIPSCELSELLNNLLNNAFEAVDELPVDKRIVNLVVSHHKIEVLNYISDNFDEKSIMLFDQRGYSTKGINRGYGLSNVKNIAEKYNGALKINRDGEILCIEILFQ